MKRSKIVVNKPSSETTALPIASHGCIVEVQKKFAKFSHSRLMIVTATKDYCYLTELGEYGMTLKVKPEQPGGLVMGI